MDKLWPDVNFQSGVRHAGQSIARLQFDLAISGERQTNGLALMAYNFCCDKVHGRRTS